MCSNYILFGSSGHLLSCIEVIKSNINYNILGYISPKKNTKLDINYFGDDNEFKIPNLKNIYGLVAIGNFKLLNKREVLFNFYRDKGVRFKKVISSTSYVSNSANIDEGSILMHQTFVNTHVTIGKNCIINTGSIIEHETNILNNSVISPRCTINGGVNIGSNCYIGTGTIIHENVIIEDNCIIGSGLVIRKNITKNSKTISQRQIDK